jgi:anaerobic magnesium-protoporphyrin IX monomethyl ester cyclase
MDLNLVNSNIDQYKKSLSIVLISLFGYDFGIRYISSFLKEQGYQTYIIQFNQLKWSVEFLDNDYFTVPLLEHKICSWEDLTLLLDLLKQLNPKVVGISLTSVTMKTAQIITLEIKKHLETIVVWGGIHAIIAPEECIQYADIVCIGEGEIPMEELVEKISKNEPLTGIKNLWINNNGNIEKNELRPLIDDLDSLPFADFIEEDNKFLIDSGKIVKGPSIVSGYEQYTYPIISSRGCMFACSFCCNSILKEKYKGKGLYLRRRSVIKVIEELKLAIRKKNIFSIRFWDDVFTYDKDWIEAFCSRYLLEIGKAFTCYAHPKYTDRKILTELANKGLVVIVVGLQSGSETINRDVFARTQSNQDILEFTKIFKRLYITPRYDMISENPYETAQEQNNSIEFILKLPRPYMMQFYSLCYFPKTPLTKRALDDKVIDIQDLEQYSSKALNNFFMFLPLSKTKEQLFWNCIKAMAVNERFPKGLVQFCKSSRFLSRYPRLIFFLSRCYLYLFKHIRHKKSRSRATWAIPALTHKISFNSYFVLGNTQALFHKPKISFSFFPLNNTNTSKRFCLNIAHKFRNSLFISFLIEVILLTETRMSNKTVWCIKLEIENCYQKNIYLDLKYPELYFSFDGKRRRPKLLRKSNFETGDKRLYILQVKYRTLGKSIHRGSPYYLAGRVLCNI